VADKCVGASEQDRRRRIEFEVRHANRRRRGQVLEALADLFESRFGLGLQVAQLKDNPRMIGFTRRGETVGRRRRDREKAELEIPRNTRKSSGTPSDRPPHPPCHRRTS
jgi:hypothetical protein